MLASLKAGPARSRWAGARSKLVAAVGALTCALVLSGCNDLIVGSWGSNFFGQLGDGTFVQSDVPVAVDASGALGGKTVVHVSAIEATSCAVASDGTVACWGELNWLSPTGAQTKVNRPTLIDTSLLIPGAIATQVAADPSGICVLGSSGKVGCRTFAGSRQLAGVLIDQAVTQLSGTPFGGCAVTSKGKAACWGENSSGEVGNGTLAFAPEPVFVDTSGALAGKTIAQVSSQGMNRCALTTDAVVACWGNGAFGQLGNGGFVNSSVPVLVDTSGALAGKTVTSLATSDGERMCAVTSDGGAACWGTGENGELGDGNDNGSPVPVTVAMVGALAGKTIETITNGQWHTCALLTDGTGSCWGLNGLGTLGDGSTTNSLIPVAVVPLAGEGGTPRPMVALEAAAGANLAIYRTTEPSQYVPRQSPMRVLDTRNGGGPVGSGAPVTVDLSAAVPAGATAISFNLTVTGQTASGFAEVAPAGAPAGSSTINWGGAQRTIANAYISKISADRKVDIQVTSAGTAQLVLDVFGYFAPKTGASPDASLFTPVERRIYDSRQGPGPIPVGAALPVNIYANGGVPPAVAPIAAVVNVTVTGTTNTGVLTVAEQKSSASSAINWNGPNQTIANALITKVMPDGTFAITNNSNAGAAQVVVDLLGVFAPSESGGTGAEFYPLDPVRTYDSRIGTIGPLFATTSRVTNSAVPIDAVAQVVNTTVTGTTFTGYLSVSAPMAGPPQTSMVNWYVSPTTAANGSIVPSGGQALQAFAGGTERPGLPPGPPGSGAVPPITLPTTQYLFDVGGYFR